MSEQQRDASRWALLIGIDRYPGLDARYQLAGCVNDVEVMASLLVDHFGFPADHVVRLTDGAATRDGILAAFEGLFTRVQSGDVVVLHYSGHGSQARSSSPDEADGLDETIVPHDVSRAPGEPGRDIHDKEIHAWLERLTAVTENVTLVFDSCHSGGITRDSSGAPSRWVPPALAAAAGGGTRGARPAARDAADKGPSGWVPLGRRYVLLAGCRSCETSFELLPAGDRTVQHGALTYFVSRALSQVAANATYRDVFEQVAVQVTGNSSLQHPQLEGEADRVLFGLERFEPVRFAAVRERHGQEVKLAVGSAMGAARGSIWNVYPPGTKQMTGEPDGLLGTVRISAAGGTESTAEIVSEASPGAIAVPARAVEISHAYGDQTMSVRLDPSCGGDDECIFLRQAVATSDVLREAADGEPAQATVHLLAIRQSAEAEDPVYKVTEVTAPTWAVTGNGGELIMPLKAAGRGAAREVLENLRLWARYQVLLEVKNPLSTLVGGFEMVLLRQNGNGEWVAASSDPGGRPVFTAGDRLAFELVNRSSRPLYFGVLDMGLSGRIEPLFPPAGLDEPVDANRSLRFGTQFGEQMPLGMPDKWPFVPGASAAGQETLKVIATTRPVDFTILRQGAFRGVARDHGGALSSLLAMAGGAATRDAIVQSNLNDDEWATLNRSLWLQPPAAAS